MVPQNCILLVIIFRLWHSHGEITGGHSDDGLSSAVKVTEEENKPSDRPIPKVCTPQLDIEPMVFPILPFLYQMDTFKAVEAQVFDGCTPRCLNGGVCRDTQVSKAKECLCPLNYSGQNCDIESVPLLTFCDEPTCQNGGSCAGSPARPTCSCPENVRGHLCERRARSYQVLFKIVKLQSNGTISEEFTKNLKESATVAERLLDLSAKLGDDSVLVQTYLRSEFHSYLNETDSIVIRTLFDFTDTMAAVYTEQCIHGHLMTGTARLYQLLNEWHRESDANAWQVKMSSFQVQVEDVCAYGNNDCSRHAKCRSLGPGVYTCVCNAFSIDVSLDDKFPGRRCVYDGLIILIFVLVGFVLSTLIIVFCGCRRTIWYRYSKKGATEHMTLVNLAKNYDI